jgi:glutamate racemase
VLATEGTVNSGAYPRVLGAYDARATIAQVPCPRFVPLVESGQTESEDAFDAAREYLTYLAQLRCRTVILGCTHYPYLLPALRRVADEMFEQPVTFIDPAREAAESLAEIAEDPGSNRGRSLLLTTGNPDNFQCQAPALLTAVPRASYDTGAAHWIDGRLTTDR